MIILGIDPGMRGGVATLDNGVPVEALPMPVLAGDIDSRELRAIIATSGAQQAVIELQSIRNAQAGALKIGVNYGRLLCTCELLDLPYRIVTPPVWSKRAGIKAGMKGREKKQAHYAAAQREWGDAFTRLKLRQSQDGPVDALLIARYGHKPID